jgi:hypothetical protein
VRVTFTEFECVAPSGTSRKTYLALVDRKWLPIRSIAHALTRMEASSPGVVWRRCIEVTLPIDTLIDCVTETVAREPNANVTAILMGRAQGMRHKRTRTRLRVASNGQLIPSPGDASE